MDSLDGTEARFFFTFFDPRFKGLKFLADGEKTVVHDNDIELVQPLTSQKNHDRVNLRKKNI